MKYLQRSFSSPPASDAYRDNHAATFGEQRKVCGWCQDTGQCIRVVDELGIRMVSEPCPKGCEAPGSLTDQQIEDALEKGRRDRELAERHAYKPAGRY